MTPEQESELAALKAALKQHIEEAEKATQGPWIVAEHSWQDSSVLTKARDGERHIAILSIPDDEETADRLGKLRDANAAFIARARTMSPIACRIALAGIRALEEIASEDKAQVYVADLGADGDLLSILSIWKGGQP